MIIFQLYCARLVSLVLTVVQTEILCFLDDVGLLMPMPKQLGILGSHLPMTEGLQMRTMKMSTPCNKLIMSLSTKYFQTLSLPQIQDKMKPKSSENQVTPIMTKILKITLKLLLFRWARGEIRNSLLVPRLACVSLHVSYSFLDVSTKKTRFAVWKKRRKSMLSSRSNLSTKALDMIV